MDSKIKISENKQGKDIYSPRFALTFNQRGPIEKQRHYSYEVMSKLIGGSDVIIELDSSLQALLPAERETYAKKFLEEVRELSLEYKCSKIASNASRSFLSFLFGGKSQQASDILIYVPNDVWKTENFEKILPLYGARYFIAKGKEKGPEFLDDFQKMLDEEKTEYFKLIAFCAITLNSIGIISKDMSLDNLKSTLGVTQ